MLTAYCGSGYGGSHVAVLVNLEGLHGEWGKFPSEHGAGQALAAVLSPAEARHTLDEISKDI